MYSNTSINYVIFYSDARNLVTKLKALPNSQSNFRNRDARIHWGFTLLASPTLYNMYIPIPRLYISTTHQNMQLSKTTQFNMHYIFEPKYTTK
jgi:hypothetical protein